MSRYFDKSDILPKLKTARYVCSDMRTDSYHSWEIKQELYELLWELQEIIESCPTFSLEQEWLEEQEKIKLLKYLGKKY